MRQYFSRSRYQFLATIVMVIAAIAVVSGFKTKPQVDFLTIKPFAVVELFTSEGCSSCPPADRLLTNLVTEASSKELNLFALSFHVNYWDYLGWKDPFASQTYTNRQRSYARQLGSGVYTPQMVINGSAEFVGSNRNQAAQRINQALLNDKSPVKIDDLRIRKSNNKLSINFDVDGDGTGKVAHVALVEKELEVDVARGENRGRKLHHDNVVRLFKSISISKGENFETAMTLPKGINTERSTVIVYLQDNESLKIFDAMGGSW